MRIEDKIAKLEAEAEAADSPSLEDKDEAVETTKEVEQQEVKTEPEGSQTEGNNEPEQKADTSDVNNPDDSDLSVENLNQKLANAEASYANARAKMTQATQEVAQLKRDKEELQQEVGYLKSQIQLLGEASKKADAPEQSGEKEEQQTPDELATIRQEYGDDFNPLLNKVQSLEEKLSAKEKADAEREKAAEAKKMADKEAEEKSEQEAQYAEWKAEIEKEHPDAFTAVTTDDFQGWLLRQSGEIQRIYSKGSAIETNYMLSLYKKAVGLDKAAANERETTLLEEAKRVASPEVSSVKQQPNGDGPITMTEEEYMNIPPEEFLINEEKYDNVVIV